MKNVKSIILLATLAASTLLTPVILAGQWTDLISSAKDRIFSAETGKNLCQYMEFYVGLPASTVTALAGIIGIGSIIEARLKLPKPNNGLGANTGFGLALYGMVTSLGTAGMVASYLGKSYMAASCRRYHGRN